MRDAGLVQASHLRLQVDGVAVRCDVAVRLTLLAVVGGIGRAGKMRGGCRRDPQPRRAVGLISAQRFQVERYVAGGISVRDIAGDHLLPLVEPSHTLLDGSERCAAPVHARQCPAP